MPVHDIEGAEDAEGFPDRGPTDAAHVGELPFGGQTGPFLVLTGPDGLHNAVQDQEGPSSA